MANSSDGIIESFPILFMSGIALHNSVKAYLSFFFIKSKLYFFSSFVLFAHVLYTVYWCSDKDPFFCFDCVYCLFSGKGACLDKLDCRAYGNQVCSNYPEWTQLNCPKHCHLCPEGSYPLAPYIYMFCFYRLFWSC